MSWQILFLWNINLYQNVSTLRQLARIVPFVRLISLMAYTVNTMAADALTTQWAKTSKLSIPSFLYTIRRNTWKVKTNIIISGNYNGGVNSYLFPQDWRSPARPHIAIYITSTTRSFNLLSRFCDVHVISQNMHRGLLCALYCGGGTKTIVVGHCDLPIFYMVVLLALGQAHNCVITTEVTEKDVVIINCQLISPWWVNIGSDNGLSPIRHQAII